MKSQVSIKKTITLVFTPEEIRAMVADAVRKRHPEAISRVIDVEFDCSQDFLREVEASFTIFIEESGPEEKA